MKRGETLLPAKQCVEKMAVLFENILIKEENIENSVFSCETYFTDKKKKSSPNSVRKLTLLWDVSLWL